VWAGDLFQKFADHSPTCCRNERALRNNQSRPFREKVILGKGGSWKTKSSNGNKPEELVDRAEKTRNPWRRWELTTGKGEKGRKGLSWKKARKIREQLLTMQETVGHKLKMLLKIAEEGAFQPRSRNGNEEREDHKNKGRRGP